MKIKIKPSRAISGLDYDIKTKTLKIQFTSSARFYDFYNVPAREVLNLKQADSIGKYYNTHIRNKYTN